ncbi:MAG: hypothetical protein JRI54_14710, partial [Deltaproteobacteria bacterium]|nr:hypothetical protein [Deltaproteobacteria bacterium]
KVEKADAFANLPEGDYLLAVYETTFTGQAETRETVVLTSAEDGYKLAAYEFSRNVWPEALRIIGNGLFVVFFIMILLAAVTWAMGKFIQKIENSKKEENGS